MLKFPLHSVKQNVNIKAAGETLAQGIYEKKCVRNGLTHFFYCSEILIPFPTFSLQKQNIQ